EGPLQCTGCHSQLAHSFMSSGPSPAPCGCVPPVFDMGLSDMGGTETLCQWPLRCGGNAGWRKE
ncbi:hypothetical protein XENOCAPTIV_018242, partial [Xenoophorus captivus]